MFPRRRRRLIVLALGLLVLTGAAVSAGLLWSPGARKARHLGRGDRYLSQAQHREAIIEYRNVLQLEPTNARAIRQLGLAHYQLGELEPALHYLARSQEAEPDDVEIRLKLAAAYLLARQSQRAREQVAYVLEREPKKLEALVLLAGAATTLPEIDATLRRLEAARPDLGDKAQLHLALGTLYARKGDWSGVERAFKQAVAMEPRSLDARTALAELFVRRRDMAQAEREFRAAADLSPVGAPAWITLADFYLRAQKPEAAKRLLGEIAEKVPDHPRAWGRLAEIALGEGKYDESLRAVQVVLAKNPSSLEAQFLRGRVYLAQRKPHEAVQDFERILKFEPKLL